MMTGILLKVVEYGIVFGMEWLLNHKTVGIGAELARAVLAGVAKSKANSVTEDMLEGAMKVL